MKLIQLFESLTRDSIINKMRDEQEKVGVRAMNCRLAVQLTIDHSKIEDLEQIKFKDLEIGDIISWGIRHYAIWIGHGQVVQVGGWGEEVTIEDYKSLLEYWDKPTTFYRNPNR